MSGLTARLRSKLMSAGRTVLTASQKTVRSRVHNLKDTMTI